MHAGDQPHLGQRGGSLSRRLEAFYLGNGGWPEEETGLLVMKRMHWSEQDYLSASARLVDAVLIDMAAESSAARIQSQWAKRGR